MKLKAILFLTLCSIAFAEEKDDPFRDIFFPPELVIQNQQLLGLTEEQRTFLRTEIRQSQSAFTDLQWKLQDEMEKLLGLLRQTPADEQRSIAQLDKVLAAEHDIKKAQVTLMLRIRNDLRPEQLAKLKELQAKSRAR